MIFGSSVLSNFLGFRANRCGGMMLISHWLINCFYLHLLVIFCSTREKVVQSYFWSYKTSNNQNSCLDDHCHRLSIQVFNNGEWRNGQLMSLTRSDCDSNVYLGEIICPLINVDEPVCSLYSSWGTKITSCIDLTDGDHVFIVPLGRQFMWPAYHVGFLTAIRHIGLPTGESIVLETVSQSPRAFKVHNFFSDAEAEYLIKTLQDRISSKKSKQPVINSLFDTNSNIATTIKRRTFDMLGLFPYDDTSSDGIQIMRYTKGALYLPHHDFLQFPASTTNVIQDIKNIESIIYSNKMAAIGLGSNFSVSDAVHHDWDSGNNGTNRFATLLLYLSDVETGGETVFTHSSASKEALDIDLSDDDEEVLSDVDGYLQGYQLSNKIAKNSDDRKLVETCRLQKTVTPKRLQALLFYSQLANGSIDLSAEHGSCPVIEGEKWLAKIFVWNGPRSGSWTINGFTGKRERPNLVSVSVSFEAKDVTGASLYWEGQFWEHLVPGRPLKVNSYPGHKWMVKKDSVTLVTWTISSKIGQRFVLTAMDVQ